MTEKAGQRCGTCGQSKVVTVTAGTAIGPCPECGLYKSLEISNGGAERGAAAGTPFFQLPCGHSSQYTYPPDAGENFYCLLCECNLAMKSEERGASPPAPPRPQEWEATPQDVKIEQAYKVAGEHSRNQPHKTIPMLVWADIDAGIAKLVQDLNNIPGVRTDASCQGQEFGPNPYKAYVMASWPAEIDARLRAQFEIENLGENWGYIRPKSEHSGVSTLSPQPEKK